MQTFQQSTSVCRFFLFSVLSLLLLLPLQGWAQTVIYVDTDASGSNNGSSWANAFTDLQDALSNAGADDEIWVAAGTYLPTTVPTDRNATFQMKTGVAIYGGFDGTETALEERDWQTNETILSGDIDQNDTVDPNNPDIGGNSYSVVTGSGTDNTAILDGFTVTGGNADDDFNSSAGPERNGGGMYNSNGSPTLTNVSFSGNSANEGGGMYNIAGGSPTLTNVTFSGNSATRAAGGTTRGGGMYNIAGSATLTNVTFSGNSATYGGGMINDADSATLTNVTFSGNSASLLGGGMANSGSPTLTNVTFSGNSATDGGGMYNDVSVSTLTNVTFSGNSASSLGGGMANSGSPTLTNVTFSENSASLRGGGMYNDFSVSTLTNVTFSGNSAADGGGMYNSDSSPILTNVSFSGNSATDGGGMYNGGIVGSSPTIQNSIFWGNGTEIENEGGSTPEITNSIVQGGCPVGSTCTSVDDIDPVFVGGGNLRLQVSSPAIDKGDNAVIPTGVTTDLDGNARIFGGTVDLGAYEAIYYDITVTASDGGNASCDPTRVLAGGSSTCTATPEEGFEFAGWTGACSGTTCSLTNIDADQTVNADFDRLFTVGGIVAGLADGNSVVLANNGGDNQTVTSDAPVFTFSFQSDNTDYAVSVVTNPTNPNQTCEVVNNGTGTLDGSNVTNVEVVCTTDDQIFSDRFAQP